MLTRALEIGSNTDAREAIIEQTLKYLDTDSIWYKKILETHLS